MTPAAGAFLDELIDYAGLFPPAALDVPAAVAEYARHRAEAEAWMMGRFIAPAASLGAIATAMADLPEGGPTWPFSVLVGARDGAAAALAALAAQAANIARFEGALAGRVRVECLETPVPADGAAEAESFVPRLLAGLAAVGLQERELYLEVPPDGADSDLLRVLARESARRAAGGGDSPRLGAKLRCGGVTADAFPTCEQVAAVIGACAGLELPLKCTAGLHHPVRHRAAEPDVMMHGFLNVFGAGVLAWALRPAPEVLLGCIAETDPAAFVFDADGFAWRDHHVDVVSIRRIRCRALAGFGSCSFAEPRADLRALGVL